ncbi:hypothetical protein AAG570_009746 [Ranatra chinensis]|uniref:Uncharacterized protein n=1 Tax=Ranatra chinensis TaxID=642074 RepID=A0ABD0YQK2_9HEMI
MSWLKQLIRKKNLKETAQEGSQLGKVLSTFDLTALGVGCTLGVGIFVLPGAVAKYLAGPGVIFSFFYAALTSVFAGLCFAEFGARVPKAGSAYTYSYVTVGEFIAFVIGWTLIMEYAIGSASVAKGLSVYLSSSFNGKLEDFHRRYFPLGETPFFAEYFDFFGFIITITTTIGLAVGVKESVLLNNFLTSINVSIVLFVIIVGSFKADLKNWEIPASDVPEWAGTGGFLPYGISGTIAGAATCFFGYVGFDCISASGEEVKNPQKAIPLSIILSLTIVFFAYFGISAVITLMWPYYLQDPDAPLPYVFLKVNWPWAQWIVVVGGVFGLLASMIGGMFPLPRIIYAMANDGLLFKCLGIVNVKFQTPLIGTVISGIITGIMAGALKLKQLVDLMSIGTLLAYTIVSACVLLLRDSEPYEYIEQTNLVTSKIKVTFRSILGQLFNYKVLKTPSEITSTVVTINTFLFSKLAITYFTAWYNFGVYFNALF